MPRDKNNLYQTFGCNSKEELYSLVREKSEQVQPLINYLNYVKGNIANKNERISSPEILSEYFNSIETPRGEKTTILFVDTKNQPLLLEEMDLGQKETMKNTIKRGVIAGANAAFLAVESLANVREKIESFRDIIETLGIKLTDVMHCNKNDNTIYTEEGESKIYNSNKRNIVDHISEDDFIDYSKKEEYLNLVNFYTKEKIKGLNIVKDIEEIKNTMKVGYQHNKQEIFGCILYDKKNQIMEVKDMTMGGLNAAIVDSRIILRNLLTIEGLKGVAFYHNHPSGNPSPSEEDRNITYRLMDNLKNFDIEYFDHFIIAKERVFSFVDEVLGCESMNLEYQDATFAREQSEKYNLNTSVGEKIKNIERRLNKMNQMEKRINKLKFKSILKNIDTDNRYDSEQKDLIKKGIDEGLDVNKYADPKYKHEQMFQIYRGLQDGIDVNYYNDPKFEPIQMDLIRYSLYDGINVSEFANSKYSYEEMLKIYKDKYQKEIRKRNPIKKGDIVKTALSDNTMVLKVENKVEDEVALLFSGTEFIVAHGIKKEDDYVHWRQGYYYDELPKDPFNGLEYREDKTKDYFYKINEMRDIDYKSFVKALVRIEKGIEDDEVLDQIYDKYDEIYDKYSSNIFKKGASLINGCFDEIIQKLSDEADLANDIADDWDMEI